MDIELTKDEQEILLFLDSNYKVSVDEIRENCTHLKSVNNVLSTLMNKDFVNGWVDKLNDHDSYVDIYYSITIKGEEAIEWI